MNRPVKGGRETLSWWNIQLISTQTGVAHKGAHTPGERRAEPTEPAGEGGSGGLTLVTVHPTLSPAQKPLRVRYMGARVERCPLMPSAASA